MHKYAFPRYINSDRTFDLEQLTDKINLKRHLIVNWLNHLNLFRMSKDIRSFFEKKKVKIRYESNSLKEQRKARKDKIEKGPRQATIVSLGRVIVLEEFERCKG